MINVKEPPLLKISPKGSFYFKYSSLVDSQYIMYLFHEECDRRLKMFYFSPK